MWPCILKQCITLMEPISTLTSISCLLYHVSYVEIRSLTLLHSVVRNMSENIYSLHIFYDTTLFSLFPHPQLYLQYICTRVLIAIYLIRSFWYVIPHIIRKLLCVL